MEGRLARERARTLASHLEQCQCCRAEVLTQIVVKRALASTPDLLPPDTLFDKIARRLDDEIASTQFAARAIRAPQKKTARRVV